MDRRKRYRQTVALMFMLSETKTIDNVDIATFDGNGENLFSLIVGVDPMQDLPGYDSPWPAGGGKNLFDASSATFKKWQLLRNAFTTRDDSYSGVVFSVDGDTVTVTTTGTYTGIGFDLSASSSVRTVSISGSANQIGFYSAYEDGATQLSYGATSCSIPADTAGFVGVRFNAIGTYTIKFQLETGSTATAWTPYSNICPISGWTECNISHSGADTSDPTIYTIAFPSEAGTVYGGTLDVVRKKLTVNRGNIESYNGETLIGEWLSDRDVYSVGATPTIGAQVVYELATPLVYDLADVTTIQTYEGENNIWADTGKIIFLEYEA